MKKEITKIQDFVQFVEAELITQNQSYNLLSGGNSFNDSDDDTEKNKHNKDCCNSTTNEGQKTNPTH